jgi:hypothetical protein
LYDRMSIVWSSSVSGTTIANSRIAIQLKFSTTRPSGSRMSSSPTSNHGGRRSSTRRARIFQG